ncbi:hypothetical protein [Pannonibacter sp. SL95]|uniref:hypothetical protein n=1 Tax=Pannonibacter sp. SL95 TaxID=2995153 RepID=UPI0022734B61|nr:hypothetical protein [Pannonibacter sp. SL95]MCY1704444.1 hypothetical protein [Pannonibacter sp. SL95]MCY1704532.1 hypothetical protein [Pannonibacter sp. SL95]
MPAKPTHSFATYTYLGPVQSVSLRGKDTDGNTVTFFEETLCPGRDYLLPEGHAAVAGWKALNLIMPAHQASNGDA